jgi:hypothetical protein
MKRKSFVAKTFSKLAHALLRPQRLISKSFLVLFFKKEHLPFFLPTVILLGGAAPPLGATAAGTVQGALVVGGGNACMVHGIIDPTGAKFDNLGPAVALFRQDVAGGTMALTLPLVAHGTITTTGGVTTAAYDYMATGTASLSFTSATAGSVTFIGGGNSLPNSNTAPSFTNYAATWNAGAKALQVQMDFVMGSCILPMTANFVF